VVELDLLPIDVIRTNPVYDVIQVWILDRWLYLCPFLLVRMTWTLGTSHFVLVDQMGPNIKLCRRTRRCSRILMAY
jgi:hypothetical protein